MILNKILHVIFSVLIFTNNLEVNMVNREKEILLAYKLLGFKPRDNQLQIISDIVSAYVDSKKKNVILCAGTGIGKSIIAAVVAEVLKNLNSTNLAAIYMSSTNSLVDQYTDSFSKLHDDKFFRIKGANTYPCNYFRMKGNQFASGEDCVKSELTDVETNKYCAGCTYISSRQMVNKTENLITNYAYFMISKLKSDHLEERPLQVFDEAHLLNDVYCSQVAIEVSVESIEKLCKDLGELNGKLDNEQADLVMFKSEISAGRIKANNYKEKMKALGLIYIAVTTKCTSLAALIPDLKAKVKTRKIGMRFARLAGMIGGFFEHQYEHVFDDTIKNTISIKPIFVSDMMHLLLGKYNLFMTATLSPDFAETTMKLDPAQTAYITADEIFPAENKPIFFLGKENLNYQKMSDPQTFKDMAKVVEYIVSHHAKEKGIIIVPSFYAAKSLSAAIPKSVKLFQHTQGTNVAVHVEAFKKWSGPSVLISPSIFEGLDFKDDESRYQIIVKTPYPSLGDVRIKYIADYYGGMYREMTLYKILQGIGRSVRSKEDYAVTYCLDKATETLFKSKLNIWKDRFLIK